MSERASILVALPARLLGRHISRRSHHHAGLGLAGRGAVGAGELGDAEVDHLDEVLPPLVDDQVDVIGLDVAVVDLVLVRGLQRLAELQHDRPHHLERVGLSLLDKLLQSLADQELHDEVVPVVLGDVEVEDLEDVVVADDVHGPRLVEEALDDLLVVRVLRVEELDRHPRADHRVLGGVDGAHAALAERLGDHVAADGAADQLVHLFRRLLRGKLGVRRQLFDGLFVLGHVGAPRRKNLGRTRSRRTIEKSLAPSQCQGGSRISMARPVGAPTSADRPRR